MSPPVGVTAPQGRRAHQMQRQLTLGWNLVDTFRDMVKYSMDFCPSKYYLQKQSSLHNFCLGKYLSLRKKIKLIIFFIEQICVPTQSIS